MGKNIKKLLDKITGKEIQHVSVTVMSPWDSKRTRLSFNVEVKSAYLSDILELSLYISNRLVNDEVDEEEFEWLFGKAKFQEEFKEDTYDNYKLEVFGVEISSLELEYEYL